MYALSNNAFPVQRIEPPASGYRLADRVSSNATCTAALAVLIVVLRGVGQLMDVHVILLQCSVLNAGAKSRLLQFTTSEKSRGIS